MQNGLLDNLATSFSSSRSRWNTKCKKDAAAPPIWLRRVLNDATNVDFENLGSINENSPRHPNDVGGLPSHNRAARDYAREAHQLHQPPSAGINAEDASDLHLNPLAFQDGASSAQQVRQGPHDSSALLDQGSYASIHAAVSSISLGSRTVQSARRTRVPLLTSLASGSDSAADREYNTGATVLAPLVPALSLPTHSRATALIGTSVSHAPCGTAFQSSNIPPMRDELTTFRETHLHHLRQMRNSEQHQDRDESVGSDAPPGPASDRDLDQPVPSSTTDSRPAQSNGRRLSRAEERHLREWAGTLCVPSEAMDLGLALKAAASATTTFSAGAESGRSASALRPSGLRRADPNSGFSGDLSSTLASRPPRSRPSSLDQRAEPSASQPAAASRENARNSSADAFHGDLASVLSGARRQVRPSSLEVREGDNSRSMRDVRPPVPSAAEVSAGDSASTVWHGDLSAVLGGGRHRLRSQLEEARIEMGRVGPVRQNAASSGAHSSGDNGSWMLPAAAAARDALQHRHQQTQRTGASAVAPFADSMFWPEGQEMSYDALLALDRAAIQKGVPKSTLARIKKKRAADVEVGQECAVCMDNVEAKQWLRRLPCGHVYHDTCICKWFEEHVHCPLCRFDCVQNKPAGA